MRYSTNLAFASLGPLVDCAYFLCSSRSSAAAIRARSSATALATKGFPFVRGPSRWTSVLPFGWFTGPPAAIGLDPRSIVCTAAGGPRDWPPREPMPGRPCVSKLAPAPGPLPAELPLGVGVRVLALL